MAGGDDASASASASAATAKKKSSKKADKAKKKSGKKGRGDVPEPALRLEDQVLEAAFAERQACVEACNHAVRHIVASSAALLHRRGVERRAAGVAAAEMVNVLVEAAAWQAIAHDTGDAAPMRLEAEPAPCAIDRWGRGTIPVRRRPPSKQADPDQYVLKSVGSRSRRAPSSVARSQARRQQHQQQQQPGVERVPSAAARGTLESVDEQDKVRDAELQRLALEKKAKARQREAERLAEEERRRAQQRELELKGKDYAYDEHGNPIVLTKLNPEKLPAFTYAPKVMVTAADEDGGGAAEAHRASASGRGSGAGGNAEEKAKTSRKKGGKMARSNTMQELGIEPATRVEHAKMQPHLVDAIELSSGVTVRDQRGVSKTAAQPAQQQRPMPPKTGAPVVPRAPAGDEKERKDGVAAVRPGRRLVVAHQDGQTQKTMKKKRTKKKSTSAAPLETKGDPSSQQQHQQQHKKKKPTLTTGTPTHVSIARRPRDRLRRDVTATHEKHMRQQALPRLVVPEAAGVGDGAGGGGGSGRKKKKKKGDEIVLTPQARRYL